MFGFALAFLGYLFLACLLASLIYVLGTYLLLSYDRKIGRAGQVSPSDDPPISLPRGLSCFGHLLLETGATLLFVLLFPFGFFSRSPWVYRKARRRPILFVHGFNHNQSAWVFLRLRLRLAGFGPLYSVDLSPTGRPIEVMAQEVERLAGQIEQETRVHNLVLVGHSMGGIVASYYTEELAPFGKVSHLITLGTPFYGTRSACLQSCPSAKAMRPGSELLAELRERIGANTYTRYCQVAAAYDNLIYPYQSALLKGGDQLLLTQAGHLGLLFSSSAAKQIIYWLKEAAPLEKPKSPPKAKRRVAYHP
ncbi:MAG: esterase/lipase family protein [Parachlamydiales bacterium]